MRALTILSCLVVVLGCDSAPTPTDAGPDGAIRDSGSDSGTVDAMADAGRDGALGSACASAAQCDTGTTCFHPLQAIDLGDGYCSHGCSTDADCSDMPADGFDYTCVNEGTSSRCARTCPGGFGCQDGHVCIVDFGLSSGGDTADLCFDVRADACTSDSDCTLPARCTIQIDRERSARFCYTPRAPAGPPLPLLGPGEACNPLPPIPCADATPCPTGWLCAPRPGDMRRVCTAPAAQRCTLLCLLPGMCTGLCETDTDCPTDMRCSGGPYNFGPSTPEVGFDDVWVDVGICTYAAGSRAPCTRAADCASTGTGGASEVCWPTTDAAGAVNMVCVTPGAGMVRQGDPCGDDLMTAAIEVRNCAGACIANVCAEVCASDADCGTGSRCASFLTNASESNSFCIVDSPCVTSADCTGTDICGALAESDGTTTRTCFPASGALAAGSVCEVAPSEFVAPAESCAVATCNDVGEGPTMGRCTEICDTDAECPADFRCAFSQITINNGGTLDTADDVNATVGQCAYAPGSGNVCTVSSGCPTGEYCAALLNASLAANRRCVTAVVGGVAPGGTCDVDMGCAERSCFTTWLDLTESTCVGLCVSDGDCPSGTACRRFRTATDVTVCLPPGDGRGLPL